MSREDKLELARVLHEQVCAAFAGESDEEAEPWEECDASEIEADLEAVDMLLEKIQALGYEIVDTSSDLPVRIRFE